MSDEMAKENKKKGGRIALIICIIVIAALCIIIYLLLNKDEDKKERRDVVVNEDNVEEILSDLGDSVPPGSYQVTMNSTWYFENGTASSNNAYVENAEANENAVYFDVVRSSSRWPTPSTPIILTYISLCCLLTNGRKKSRTRNARSKRRKSSAPPLTNRRNAMCRSAKWCWKRPNVWLYIQ